MPSWPPANRPMLEAKLTKFKGEDIEEVHTQAEADAIVAAAGKASWRRYPPSPSRRKSAATRRLRSRPQSCSKPPTIDCDTRPSAPWASRSALYEGVELGKEGSVALITYMRTDSGARVE